ncbi:MAG: hypothetical protein MUE85_07695 [Microscillaceae bacterium]|jgi:hypothetical protein|nr:hypothetical protein [Microscillaceae bacterium]
MNEQNKINDLEDEAAEIAKEILLDEVAINEAKKTMLEGCISNLPPIALSFGEGRVRQKKRVNLKCTHA